MIATMINDFLIDFKNMRFYSQYLNSYKHVTHVLNFSRGKFLCHNFFALNVTKIFSFKIQYLTL